MLMSKFTTSKPNNYHKRRGVTLATIRITIFTHNVHNSQTSRQKFYLFHKVAILIETKKELLNKYKFLRLYGTPVSLN